MTPFTVSIADEILLDLRHRITRTRFPPPSPAPPWADGTDGDYLRGLLDYWADGFDWRAQERRINALPQFMAVADACRLHFVHLPSPRADALPLLLIHGWPGSFWEFHRIAPLLTDRFHLVIPSLPGYGFSSSPTTSGCDPAAIARAFAALMAHIGYQRFGVQGGDWGARIGAHLAVSAPSRVVGLHLNFPGFISPPPDYDGAGLTDADRAALNQGRMFGRDNAAYIALQSTRPQTPAYGLSDSPSGLAAWISEKYREWTDCGGNLDNAISRDDLLTIITIYWVTNTIGPSMRLYREHGRRPWTQDIPVPAACAVFPAEVSPPVRVWVEQFLDIRQWTTMPRGGHFAALEQPELLAADVEQFFARV